VAIPAILLDANVLFTFALRDTILMAAEDDLCLVYWSARILEEMRDAFPDALVEGYENHISRMTNHPDDRHIAAAALHAGVDTIVTFNLRHFPGDALASHGLRAQHPDPFLLDLFTDNREAMREIIAQQAEARRRPAQTVMQILEGMSRLTPRFAAAVRAALLAGEGA
jgi:hypothetical protein